jgi:hypothetical protein
MAALESMKRNESDPAWVPWLGLFGLGILASGVVHGLPAPEYWGAVGSVITCVTVIYLRRLSGPGSRAERTMWTIFLTLMPVVYVAAWIRAGVAREALGVEIAGLVAFGLAALLGRRSPWFVVAGIGAHGLWDTWHIWNAVFLGPRYITRWYAVFCLVVDVGFAAYAASVLRNLAPGSQRPAHWTREDRERTPMISGE